MKRYFCFFFLLIICCTACQKKDRVVAEIYYHKLYASEVVAQMPHGLSDNDSIDLANSIIHDWIVEQIVLHDANKVLSLTEKNCEKELEMYRKNVIKQKYFDKLTADTSLYNVSDEEVINFIKLTNGKWEVERNLVKINYIKSAKNSAIIPQIKEILFDESRRVTEKSEIENLCADSVEYFIDDDQWLSWDDIQQEVNVDLTKQDQQFPKYIEKVQGQSCYLMAILAYKSDQASTESNAYIENVRNLLIQKKKAEYIQQHVEKLRLQAEQSGKIIK